MGKPAARTDTHWSEKSRCRFLDSRESDKLFFPGPGGKSNAAKRFCESCPVVSECLKEAIASRAVGFVAGTTEQERTAMVGMLADVNYYLDTGEFLPEIEEKDKPKRRPKQLKKRVNKLDDPLYGVEGPTEEELKQLEEAC